jgi:2-dehydropantoate 2-reductase
MSTVVVVGSGAIGCAVGSALVDTGAHRVVFCAHTFFDHLDVSFPTGDSVVSPAEVYTTAPSLPEADWVLLCVKAQQVPATESWLRAAVTPETKVAVLQNGVEHYEYITPIIGRRERILPVVVQIPAERIAPGTVKLTGNPHLVVPQGDLGQAFETLFHGSRIPVKPTEDFVKSLWEKLCLNAANGSITALTERDQSVIREPEVAELCRQIVVECMAVGRAEGATLDDGLSERIVAQLAGAPGTPGGGNSMYYDRLAGRELEVDARNGVIPRLGKKHGIPTPINATLYALLKYIKPRVTSS